MKLRHLGLVLGAGAIAERYVLRDARTQFWAAARLRGAKAADWWAMGHDRTLAIRISNKLHPEENPF